MNNSEMSGSRDGTDCRIAVRNYYAADESAVMRELIASIRLSPSERESIAAAGAQTVERVRRETSPSMMESFLAEYGLSTEEGVGLMCLAEALLRVPDAETIDDLIQDKIEPSNWGAHLGHSASPLINASTWALMLTGKVLEDDPKGPAAALRKLIRRVGEPLVRTAVAQAMKLLGRQFVLGQTIDEGLRNAQELEQAGYTYSYDMLGEAARTEADAIRYHQAYAEAISAIARQSKGDVRSSPGISVKLSALHPRRAGEAGRRRQHRLQHRRRGTGSPGFVAGRDRGPDLRSVAGRLGRARYRGAGLRQARRTGDRNPLRHGLAQRPQNHGAPGQGRLLGYRGETGTGAWRGVVSGVHTQDKHRCQLHGLRANADGSA
jgi:hypothetical protein